MNIDGFEFSAGAHFQKGANVDAGKVGEHMELIRRECNGEIRPQDVVADARNANSPLHSFFEWNDGEAAEQYRLSQARGLIRAVVAIYRQEDKPPVRMNAYIHFSEPGTPHYREASQAMSIPASRDVVLRRALQELQQWGKRYRDLQEFASLFKAIAKIEKTASQLG